MSRRQSATARHEVRPHWLVTAGFRFGVTLAAAGLVRGWLLGNVVAVVLGAVGVVVGVCYLMVLKDESQRREGEDR